MRTAMTRPARSGCPCRPARRTRRSRRASGSKPNFMPRSGAKVLQARPFALDRLDRPVDRLLEPVDRDRDVDFLGRGVARIDRRLVERADPDAIVALALEIEALVEVGDERQVAQARRGRPAAGPPSAACGCRPSGDTPARCATSSPHAPAALTRIAASDRPGAGFDLPAAARARAREASAASVRTSPPCRRIARQAGVVEGGDFDVGAARLVPGAGPLLAQARESAGRARRDRDGPARYSPLRSPTSSNASPHGPVRCTRAARAQQAASSLPGQPASNIGLDARLSRRSGVSPPRLACQKAAERPVAWRPHRSSASISITRASPASRAPRLAPAIPPPTIRTSTCAPSRGWLRFGKPRRLVVAS